MSSTSDPPDVLSAPAAAALPIEAGRLPAPGMLAMGIFAPTEAGKFTPIVCATAEMAEGSPAGFETPMTASD